MEVRRGHGAWGLIRSLGASHSCWPQRTLGLCLSKEGQAAFCAHISCRDSCFAV